MSIIKKSPNIAVLFGMLAIATSLVLIFDVPKMVRYILAIFWFVIGLLAFYAAAKC